MVKQEIDEDIELYDCHLEPSEIGAACEIALLEAEKASDFVSIDLYAIMPNHIHLLVRVDDAQRSPKALASFIGRFKAYVTRRARIVDPGIVVWQRSYYDHMIRDEEDYAYTAKYIEDNPAKWAFDKYYGYSVARP